VAQLGAARPRVLNGVAGGAEQLVALDHRALEVVGDGQHHLPAREPADGADAYVNQQNYTNAWANIGMVCSNNGTATVVLADNYPLEVGADAIRAVRTGYAC
jgi:hypothetical protein